MTPLPDNFLTTFIVPDNAVIDDQKIETGADMIIGNHAVITCNVKSGFLMAGEGVHISGEIAADGDIRADVWCRFDQNVSVGGDAYLGEFTAINGKIVVEGDLDIGKEVKLNGGFLSKGWVVVRNPLPVMVFIFLYIRAMIGLGKSSDEIDKALNELFEDDEEIDFENTDEDKMSRILSRGRFFVIPLGSKISSESINVPEDVIIGNGCDISTQIICKRFESGKNLFLNGSVRSKGETLIGEGSRISGDINSSKVIIDKNVRINGKISAKTVWIHETSFVEGKISSGNIRFITGDGFDIKDPENAEKATVLSKADSFDLMNTNITEKKEEEALGADAETEETLESSLAEEELTASDESTAETESAMEGESAAEAESAADEMETGEFEADDSKTDDKPIENVKEDGAGPKTRRLSKRAQKRKNKKAAAGQHEKPAIVDVFTGENIEKIEKRSEDETGKIEQEKQKDI